MVVQGVHGQGRAPGRELREEPGVPVPVRCDADRPAHEPGVVCGRRERLAVARHRRPAGRAAPARRHRPVVQDDARQRLLLQGECAAVTPFQLSTDRGARCRTSRPTRRRESIT